MNTTTGGGATASEGSEQQQFLAELRKLEDSARQFQSEVCWQSWFNNVLE